MSGHGTPYGDDKKQGDIRSDKNKNFLRLTLSDLTEVSGDYRVLSSRADPYH